MRRIVPIHTSCPMRRALWRCAPVGLLLLAACGIPIGPDDKPDAGQPPPPPPAVTFGISSASATTTTGGTCLMFYGIPSVAVSITNVKITNPVKVADIYNMGGKTVAANVSVGLQDGYCYYKYSGSYQFDFTGTRSTDGQSFTSTAYYNSP